MRILIIVMFALVLQSCGELMPSERLASCNGTSTDCQWHDIRTHQVISLPKSHARNGTMTNDTGDANLGDTRSYQW